LDHLKLMLRTVCALRLDQSKQAKIGEWYDRVVAIQVALKNYLGQIADENLRDSDIDRRFNLLDYSQELVIIGTLIKRDLADAAVARSLKEFQADDLAELENILSRTLERMQKAMVLLMTQDVAMANRFIQEKEQISEHYRSVRKRHLERLVLGQNLNTGLFDLLNCFRRINSHLTAVAYAIVRGSSVVGPDPDESWLTGDHAVTRLKLATE
jgi:Na+/phosphate symporter